MLEQANDPQQLSIFTDLIGGIHRFRLSFGIHRCSVAGCPAKNLRMIEFLQHVSYWGVLGPLHLCELHLTQFIARDSLDLNREVGAITLHRSGDEYFVSWVKPAKEGSR